MANNYGFALHPGPREKTFTLHSKIDDHANDVHDYLKYLKFGYGRATDDASTEIRHGRMTREEGIEMVQRYDHIRPGTLDTYLDFLQISEDEFFEWVEPMRDIDIWEKKADGKWYTKDTVANHIADPGIDEVRSVLVAPEDRTFGVNNTGFYWKEGTEQKNSLSNVRGFNANDKEFIVL
jgi:hypothetical protein